MSKEKGRAGEAGERFVHEIDQIERHYLVGRQKEIQFFREQLSKKRHRGHILNIYGTGGVGKSYLLDEFRRIALHSCSRFLLLDSRDFPHNPQEFCLHLLRLLRYNLSKDEQTDNLSRLIELCQEAIQQEPEPGGVVLALDTFEELGELEYWFREEFLQQLHSEVLVVISGRYPIQGAWLSSPAWRQLISHMPIGDLDYFSVKEYLSRSGIEVENDIHQIWSKTKGHPLTLSLLVSTTLSQAMQPLAIADDNGVFAQVVHTWLKELPDPQLRGLVETAAVMRHFNQELLSCAMEIPVTTEQFLKLVGLSFVRRVDRGWLLHDLMRDAICHELQVRAPEQYKGIRKRCILFYYDLIKESVQKKLVAWETAEWFYYIGDPAILAFFYQNSGTHRWEPLNSFNWREAERYIENRYSSSKEAKITYTNPETLERYDYVISAEENLYTLKHIHLQELHELDPSIVKLIRNGQGVLSGLSVIIPINVHTLDYLRTQPLSSAYFAGLSEQMLKELKVSKESKAGYFVKTIDIPDFADQSMRAAAGLTFITHIISAGFLVAAPPANPFFGEIHQGLGCQVAKHAVHYDYDGITPTPYYVIDTRGNKLQSYLNKMLANYGMLDERRDAQQELAALTSREKEVVELIIKGHTNMEIAGKLYLSEVTVKKHLTNIFRKLDIKNRSQLIQNYKV
ncbi:LuxR family transcriptional regulator [Cohnella silvisoli]|uniref:LuxR family transcriptional regulator n=1 Tax=Cohnella silvisoli TaxID=2873699 RepID=A0ABV1KZK0_9BACL|nr:LuxR family transcriptional regulator [Cohnella silvisoli]MCD9024745.1 LuxR family transcriptional regulator [Cohnella silvisoli]